MGRFRLTPTGCVVLALLATSVVSACSRRYEPALDVSEAVVTTPDGTFELTVLRPSGCWWPLGFEGADDDGLYVMFSPLPACELLFMGRGEAHTRSDGSRYASDVEADGVAIDVDNSWYQRNDHSRMGLVLGAEQKYPTTAIFEYVPPSVLEPFQMSLIGGSLHPPVADRVQSHRRDRHRFHIAFTVDGEPHSIDLEFRLLAEGHWTIGVPGMP